MTWWGKRRDSRRGGRPARLWAGAFYQVTAITCLRAGQEWRGGLYGWFDTAGPPPYHARSLSCPPLLGAANGPDAFRAPPAPTCQSAHS